jgi:hypothetical protein
MPFLLVCVVDDGAVPPCAAKVRPGCGSGEAARCANGENNKTNNLLFLVLSLVR